jgi:UDP-N-acetylmuramoyl-tripeptide--D-alanyl-D-alanine ligase
VGHRAQLIGTSALEAGLPSAALFSVPDWQAAIEVLSGLLREGDAVLVKGSRAMGMEAIVNAFEDKHL